MRISKGDVECLINFLNESIPITFAGTKDLLDDLLNLGQEKDAEIEQERDEIIHTNFLLAGIYEKLKRKKYELTNEEAKELYYHLDFEILEQVRRCPDADTMSYFYSLLKIWKQAGEIVFPKKSNSDKNA